MSHRLRENQGKFQVGAETQTPHIAAYVKSGFSFSGKINRKDWGLNWNATLETGGVLVSDEAKIGGEVQFVKQT